MVLKAKIFLEKSSKFKISVFIFGDFMAFQWILEDIKVLWMIAIKKIFEKNMEKI